MSIENIGKVINSLRKEKKITQEELANSVGVSTQAVSKWECGGAPDIELLPVIADFFGVTLDKLFGRKENNYDGIEMKAAEYIASLDREKQYLTWYNLCWDIQRAMFGSKFLDDDKKTLKSINENKEQNSHKALLHTKQGLSWFSLIENQQYAFLMIEPEDYSQMILYAEEYQKFFTALSDIDYLNCLLFLYKREETKGFTEKLFIDNLNISEEKAKDIISFLLEYSIIRKKEIEFDDEIKSIYSFHGTSDKNASLVPFLILAKDVIKNPQGFWCSSDGSNKFIK